MSETDAVLIERLFRRRIKITTRTTPKMNATVAETVIPIIAEVGNLLVSEEELKFVAEVDGLSVREFSVVIADDCISEDCQSSCIGLILYFALAPIYTSEDHVE